MPTPAGVHQHLGSSCSTIREQNPDRREGCWGSPHPTLAAAGATSQCHSRGCSKEQLRKQWETPAQPNQPPPLQGLLQGQRGTGPTLSSPAPLPPVLPWTLPLELSYPLRPLLLSIPRHPLQRHPRGLGDQTSLPNIAGREGLFELAVKANPRNETNRGGEGSSRQQLKDAVLCLLARFISSPAVPQQLLPRT